MGGYRIVEDVSTFLTFLYYSHHTVDRKTKHKGFKNENVL